MLWIKLSAAAMPEKSISRPAALPFCRNY